jgi:hypothetical protein
MSFPGTSRPYRVVLPNRLFMTQLGHAAFNEGGLHRRGE